MTRRGQGRRITPARRAKTFSLRDITIERLEALARREGIPVSYVVDRIVADAQIEATEQKEANRAEAARLGLEREATDARG